MQTPSLVPRPKITVIGLEVRLVHKQYCKLTSGQYAQLAQSLPVVVGKAYEHHVGRRCIQLVTYSYTKK